MQPPNSPQSLLSQVDSLISAGEVVAAIATLKQALKSQPNFFQAWWRLSKLLFDTGNFAEAVQVTEAAEQLDPLQAEFQTIQQLMQRRSYADADRAAREMLAREPGHPRAVFTLAHLAGARNHPEQKVELLEYGLHHLPANLTLRHMLIEASEQAGQYEKAIETARTLVKTQESFATLWSLITVLLRYGQNEELLAVANRVRSVAGNDAKKLSDLELVRGQTLRVMGRRDDSVAAFRACLSHNPLNAGAWWALADMKTFNFSGHDRDSIEKLLNDPGVPKDQKCVATFALGKASEAAGDWDGTMDIYHRANGLYSDQAFSADQFEAAIDARIEAFNRETLSVQATQAPNGPTPIFILGLPRSGSTLIEQILASHSQIEGTIEQPVLPSTWRKAHLKCVLDYQGDILQKIGALSPDDLLDLGTSYLQDGKLFRTTENAYFTDKLPFNFLHIGLIHKILPNAIIIDARRNPLDCGFSLYKQHFPTGVDFSYSLQNIGRYYNSYLRLMDHWERVLPGRVHHLKYEELVRSPETRIRALLNKIGVEFEEACLTFHQTDRAVRTASSEQVRQPINTKGIGAWRKVEQHLQPLKLALGEATLSRFEGRFEP